jgi:hypothetical protein
LRSRRSIWGEANVTANRDASTKEGRMVIVYATWMGYCFHGRNS